MLERLRYLFVCYANVDRSPTAEAVCRRIAAEDGLEIEASSARVSRRANRPVTKEMADQADQGLTHRIIEVWLSTGARGGGMNAG